jgi:hypothetical protein
VARLNLLISDPQGRRIAPARRIPVTSPPFWGLPRLAYARCLLRYSDRPLAEIKRALGDEVGRHGAQADDRTLLLIRVK